MFGQKVSIIRKYHNHILQTHPRHREEDETQNTDKHNTIKAKQTSLPSQAR